MTAVRERTIGRLERPALRGVLVREITAKIDEMLV